MLFSLPVAVSIWCLQHYGVSNFRTRDFLARMRAKPTRKRCARLSPIQFSFFAGRKSPKASTLSVFPRVPQKKLNAHPCGPPEHKWLVTIRPQKLLTRRSYRQKCKPRQTVFHFAFECSFRDEPGTSKWIYSQSERYLISGPGAGRGVNGPSSTARDERPLKVNVSRQRAFMPSLSPDLISLTVMGFDQQTWGF